MTTMAQERDSILRIRQKVDSYDEMQEFEDIKPSATNDHAEACITFCSGQKAARVADIAKANEFSECNFTLLLSRFLGGTTQKQLETCTV